MYIQMYFGNLNGGSVTTYIHQPPTVNHNQIRLNLHSNIPRKPDCFFFCVVSDMFVM